MSSWDRATGNGHIMTKYFCPNCGSPVYGTSSRDETVVVVLIGALDDPSTLQPSRIIFKDEAQPWDTVTVGSERE